MLPFGDIKLLALSSEPRHLRIGSCLACVCRVWMHTGSVESTRKALELLEVISGEEP